MTTKIILIFFVVSCLFAVLTGMVLFDSDHKIAAFRLASYYFIFFSFFAWLAFVIKDLDFKKESFVNFIRSNFLAICLSVVFVAIFFISVKPQFRVLADETTQVSVSRSLFFDKTAENSLMGMWYYNGYHSLLSVVDKRPVLFPFLISLVHTVLGYNAHNVFVLNFIVSFLCLFNLYLLIRQISSGKLAIITIFMAASYPIFALCATSANYEMLNLFFLILTFRYFNDYLGNRQPLKLNKLLLTILLLSQCRYEMLGIVVFLMVLLFWIESKNRFAAIGAFIVILPILYIPVLWQRSALVTQTLANNPSKYIPVFFSINYLFPNLLKFVKILFQPMADQSVAFAINYLAAGGVIYGGMLLFRNIKSMSIQLRYSIFVCLAAYAYYIGILLCGIWGKMVDNPSSSRLLLILVPLFAFFASFLVDSLTKNAKLYSYLIAAMLAIFSFFHPIAVKDMLGQIYVTYRWNLLNLNFLEKFAGEDNIFVISKRPNLYTIYRLGACDFRFANHNKDFVLTRFKRHLISKIIVIQDIDLSTGKPTALTTLDPVYGSMKTLFEIQNAKDFVRYSECEQGG